MQIVRARRSCGAGRGEAGPEAWQGQRQPVDGGTDSRSEGTQARGIPGRRAVHRPTTPHALAPPTSVRSSRDTHAAAAAPGRASSSCTTPSSPRASTRVQSGAPRSACQGPMPRRRSASPSACTQEGACRVCAWVAACAAAGGRPAAAGPGASGAGWQRHGCGACRQPNGAPPGSPPQQPQPCGGARLPAGRSHLLLERRCAAPHAPQPSGQGIPACAAGAAWSCPAGRR